MTNLDRLETVLTWEGAIDNERIRQLLDVKTVWASRLLGQLSDALGRRARRVTAHAPLELVDPRSARSSPDEYLLAAAPKQNPLLRSILEDARIDMSRVSPALFSTMFKAIRQQRGVRVVYRSMTSPAGSERVIFPHAFVRAPRRWHVRAWCDQRQDYRDFTLGRIASAELIEARGVHLQGGDEEWNRFVELAIVAHPGLNAAQQAMIAQEFFPGAKSLKLKVRQCLAAYAIQDLRIAVDPAKEAPPEYQLLVSNAGKLPRLFIS